MPQLRQNIVTGEWVVIAPERSKRPKDFIAAESVREDLSESCLFCVEGELYKKQSLKDFETKDIFVIPNSYPAFLERPQDCSHRTIKLEDGFYLSRPATGGHDVVIVKRHDYQLYDFPEHLWEDLFLVAKRRYTHFRRDCNSAYTMLIYNQGVRSGASIFHPHAQIFSSNIVPNQIARELSGARQYYEQNGVCVFCDLIRHELKQKVRVIEQTKDFVAFTFYAARFPFEIWVVPCAHAAHFESQTAADLRQLARVMKRVVDRLGVTLKDPPLNFYIHDLPNTAPESEHYHWHLEIAPRVSSYGGYELGSGVVIDVMSPEDAAKYLLGKKKS